ncbi:MAG: hypothetical protein QM662_19020, partial [Gordonia sp. (in: high G+C Gram-positive bacteria)]
MTGAASAVTGGDGASAATGTDRAGLDYPKLLDTAGTVLDSVVAEFVAGVGAPSAVRKGATDFATQVDLDLE